MKTKFYPLRTLLFTLLLSFGFTKTINAQTFELRVSDATTGGDGTSTSFGNELRYTFDIEDGDATMNDIMISFAIPAGTTYVPGSTKINGVPVADVNGIMPWTTPRVIPAPVNGYSRITFYVNVTANSGIIKANATMQRTNVPAVPSQKQTVILSGNGCNNKFYALTTMYPTGVLPFAPTMYWPYQFIRELDITTGLTSLVYDGKNGICQDAANSYAPLPNGSVLTEAAAMAMQGPSNRLYFVNKPVNNVPSALCYFAVGGNVAYRLTPLTQNTTSIITRMTMDALGQGYAITDNGSEFIRFTANETQVSVDNRGTLIDAPGNFPGNSVLNETGGDIVCDGSGSLLLITFLGKLYSINTSTSMATFKMSIPGFPADGCQSVAIGADGSLYFGGHYTKTYKLTLSTLTITPLNSSSTYVNTDFASCAVPVQPARVAVNENTTKPLSALVSAQVLPNPFRKELNLQVQLTTPEIVKIRLVDFYGRTVYTASRQLGAGINSLNLAVPVNLSSGIYVVDIWAGNNRLLQNKLIKQ